jgi:nucleoside-diphosphate-sugar epimerase
MNNNLKGLVLVTGGTGFLGAYIIRELLDKGYSVRATRRSDNLPVFIPATVLKNVEWVFTDILDVVGLESAMEGVDAVIHSAAKVSFSARERKELFKTNVEGTADVVNVALEKNVKRLVYISSVAALGRAGNGERVTEEKKWSDSRYNTNYAISKFWGEVEVWRAIGEGLPAVIVNPSTLLGYGDWNSSSCKLFRSAYDEFPWYTEGVNGFVDVADTARAVVGLLDSDVTGERYILNGDNWTFRKVFDAMADGFGKRRPSREATPLLASFAWRMAGIKSLFTGQPPMLTRESARVARSATYFDNSKILRQLPGFQFTPLEVSIKAACEAYLERLRPGH